MSAGNARPRPWIVENASDGRFDSVDEIATEARNRRPGPMSRFALNFSYTAQVATPLSARELLEHLRALPARERLRVIEQAMHDAERSALEARASDLGLWATVDDAEFDAFMSTVHRFRASDELRMRDD